MLTLETVRKWYDEADAVHDFSHVERVFHLALKLAEAEGADLEIVSAAALLHDISEAHPAAGGRSRHHLASAEFAGRLLQEEGWPVERIEAVQHCIRAHRFRDDSEPPHTLEAMALFDADKLDALGAVGIARVIQHAVFMNEPLYTEPSDLFLNTGQEEDDEHHSVYHEYLFKLRRIKERLFTRTGKALAVERDAVMAAYFDQLLKEIRAQG